MNLGEAFRGQAAACGRLGSPMYDELLRALADDADANGPTAQVLRGHEDDPGPSGLALRLAGSLHRLVLGGSAPELEASYPTTGGAWDSSGVPRVLAFLADRGDELRPLLDRAPQTNEVGRSAALVGGLLHLVQAAPLPMRLFEVGASGGLNLQGDRFRLTTDDGTSWGDADSPVVLEGAWQGRPLPLGGRLDVVERGGCDLHPVDVSSDDGRLTLTSYVWPDMAARHARLAGAIELARQRPARIETADAASYVEGLQLVPGQLTVLWHSVMWQYLPAEQRQRIEERLADMGSRATAEAPLAHLFMEPVRRTPESPHEFLVCLHVWGAGDGGRQVLGTSAPHGVPVTWE